MLKFAKNAFRKCIGAILWFNLIVTTLMGGAFGARISYMRAVWMGASGGHAGFIILGLIIGAFVGLIGVIFLGGYVSTIISIDDNLKEEARLSKLILEKDDKPKA